MSDPKVKCPQCLTELGVVYEGFHRVSCITCNFEGGTEELLPQSTIVRRLVSGYDPAKPGFELVASSWGFVANKFDEALQLYLRYRPQMLNYAESTLTSITIITPTSPLSEHRQTMRLNLPE